MAYHFDCDGCGAQHGVSINELIQGVASELPERQCDVCGEDGCMDCILEGHCADCREGD